MFLNLSKQTLFIFAFCLMGTSLFAQKTAKSIENTLDDSNWNIWREGEQRSVAFTVQKDSNETYLFSLVGDALEDLKLDRDGNLTWRPRFNVVSKAEGEKIVRVNIEARNDKNKAEKILRTLELRVKDVNMPPILNKNVVIWVTESDKEIPETLEDDLYTDADGDAVRLRILDNTKLPRAFFPDARHFVYKFYFNQYQQLKQDTLTFELADERGAIAERRGLIVFKKGSSNRPPRLSIKPAARFIQLKEKEPIELRLNVLDDDNDAQTPFLALRGTNNFNPNALLSTITAGSEYAFRWTPPEDFTDEKRSPLRFRMYITVSNRKGDATTDSLELEVTNVENYAVLDAENTKKYTAIQMQFRELTTQINTASENIRRQFVKKRTRQKNRQIANIGLGTVSGVSALFTDPNIKTVGGVVGGSATLVLNGVETVVANPVIKELRDQQDALYKQLLDANAEMTVFLANYAEVEDRRKDNFKNDVRFKSQKLTTIQGEVTRILLKTE